MRLAQYQFAVLQVTVLGSTTKTACEEHSDRASKQKSHPAHFPKLYSEGPGILSSVRFAVPRKTSAPPWPRRDGRGGVGSQ